VNLTKEEKVSHMEWTTESVQATINARYQRATDSDRAWHAEHPHRSWWSRRASHSHAARMIPRPRHAS
jgi:hypothetical protein